MSRRIKVRERRSNATRSYTTSGPGIMPFRKAKPKRTKWRVARGPGSMMAEADMRQLVMAQKFQEAALLYERHIAIVGAANMKWGAAWYLDYKRSDYPQVREAVLP